MKIQHHVEERKVRSVGETLELFLVRRDRQTLGRDILPTSTGECASNKHEIYASIQHAIPSWHPHGSDSGERISGFPSGCCYGGHDPGYARSATVLPDYRLRGLPLGRDHLLVAQSDALVIRVLRVPRTMGGTHCDYRSAPELVNPSIGTLGFSLDASLATFRVRKGHSSSGSDISIRPTLCGQPKQ